MIMSETRDYEELIDTLAHSLIRSPYFDVPATNKAIAAARVLLASERTESVSPGQKLAILMLVSELIPQESEAIKQKFAGPLALSLSTRPLPVRETLLVTFVLYTLRQGNERLEATALNHARNVLHEPAGYATATRLYARRIVCILSDDMDEIQKQFDDAELKCGVKEQIDRAYWASWNVPRRAAFMLVKQALSLAAQMDEPGIVVTLLQRKIAILRDMHNRLYARSKQNRVVRKRELRIFRALIKGYVALNELPHTERQRAIALCWIGNAAGLRGNFVMARKCAEESLHLAQTMHFPDVEKEAARLLEKLQD
jgi:hypothetical protein